MRAPAAVSLQVAADRPWQGFQALAGAAAAASLTAWVAGHAGAGAVPVAAGAAGAALTAAWLAARNAVQAPRQLSWSGARWHLAAPGVPWREDDAMASPDIMIDLQGWLLLRLRPAAGGAARWLAIGRGAVPALQWHHFRAALYFRPPAAASGDGGAPASL